TPSVPVRTKPFAFARIEGSCRDCISCGWRQLLGHGGSSHLLSRARAGRARVLRDISETHLASADPSRGDPIHYACVFGTLVARVRGSAAVMSVLIACGVVCAVNRAQADG